jgi:hypothetical protein
VIRRALHQPTAPAPRLTDDVIDVVAERVAPAAPIRKKQPVAATPQAADYETVTLLKVAQGRH